MSKKILYILSPSYASYLQCKTILSDLVIEGFKVDLLIPKPNGYSLLLPKLPEILTNLKINYFLIESNPLNPFLRKLVNLNDLEYISNTRKFKFQLKIRGIINRIKNKLIPNQVTDIFLKLIRLLNTSSFLRRLLNRLNYFGKWDSIIYDINEENKLYFASLIPLIYSHKRIHISHGFDISSTHFYSKRIWIYKSNLIVTLFSGKEKSFYKWIYSLEDRNFQIIGIPNHQKKKIKIDNLESLKLLKILKDKNNLEIDSKFILLATRPADNINYCNFKERKKYLKTIGEFLKNNQKYFLLIKTHPKEKDFSIKYWKHELGIKNNLTNFCIVKNEMEILAMICKFGISFYTGSCVDFAFNKKPIIEMSAPENTAMGNLTIHYDSFGRPESSYSHNELTISVKSSKELQSKLLNIEENYNFYSEKIYNAYMNCYGVKYQFKKVLEIIKN